MKTIITSLCILFLGSAFAEKVKCDVKVSDNKSWVINKAGIEMNVNGNLAVTEDLATFDGINLEVNLLKMENNDNILISFHTTTNQSALDYTNSHTFSESLNTLSMHHNLKGETGPVIIKAICSKSSLIQ